MTLLTLLVTVTCCIGLVYGLGFETTGQAWLFTLHVESTVTIQNGQNLDPDPFLHTGQYAESFKKRSLLIFEDLPTECHTVHWAKMYVYKADSYKPSTFTRSQSPDIARDIEVYQVHKQWNYLQATSVRRTGNENWSVHGVGLDGRDAGPSVIDRSTVYPKSPSSFVEFDVSCPLAQKLGHGQNHGFLLRAQNEDVIGTDIRWISHRHSDASKHPFITVLCNSTNRAEPRADPNICRAPNQIPRTRAATTRSAAPGAGVDTYSQGYGGFVVTGGAGMPDVSNARVCDDMISRCPTTYPKYGRLLPHPTNPARYCSCRFCDAQGVTTRDMACPAGTTFNFYLQECVPQQDCGCN